MTIKKVRNRRIELFKNPKYPDKYTVDMRYVNSKNIYFWSLWWRVEAMILFSWFLFIALLIFQGISFFIPRASADLEDIRSAIRQERLEVCQEAYKDSWIREQFIYGQIPAVRCATYMSLVYAYESDFWRSRKCIQDNNCFWMKGNWVETPEGFIVFKTEKEGREYFARKYFQWHYKKDIRTFIHNWSMTDRETYIAFMKNRYEGMYRELEKQYLY